MNAKKFALLALLVLALQPAATARGLSSHEPDPVTVAFDHYESIRVALAADHMTDVPRHAKALAVVADELGVPAAKAAAEQIAATTDIKAAREHFGPLSTALIPRFEKAKLKDVHVFTCSMVGQSWAQKGKAIENPYYGKSMLACGTPKTSKTLEK